MRRLPVLGLAVALTGLGASPNASGILDFVSFDGIDYLRWAEEPGRPLARSDLGIEFATVECSLAEDARGCPFGADAAAAFMPAGTKIYEVRGYPSEFRLAAVWRDRVFLYQAWRNPRAKAGGDLYAIAGKVRAIDVLRGEPSPESHATPATITLAADVEALVTMVVHGRVRPPRAHSIGEPRYWLTFWLVDGTTLGRPYFPETGDLMGGVVVPAEFGRILERYLPD